MPDCIDCKFHMAHPTGGALVFCVRNPPTVMNVGYPGQPSFQSAYPMLDATGRGCGQFEATPWEPAVEAEEPRAAPADPRVERIARKLAVFDCGHEDEWPDYVDKAKEFAALNDPVDSA